MTSENPRPERQLRHWERVAWIVAIVAGIQTAYTTWMSGFQYMNARRDMALNIGQAQCLSYEQAKLIFENDWLTCAVGFFLYFIAAFGLPTWLLAKYQPIQDAVINPFGSHLTAGEATKKRRVLGLLAVLFFAILLLGLAATLLLDAFSTWPLIAKYACAKTMALSSRKP